MVMEGIQEDVGDGNIICTNHPYKNNTPGGICAFCLQEKLGKLVSSSFTSSIFPSTTTTTSTPPPPFRSDNFAAAATTTLSLQVQTNTNNQAKNANHYDTMRKSRMPFLLTHKKKNKKKVGNNGNSNITAATSASNAGVIMKRSKSTTTPRDNHTHFLNNNAAADDEDYTPHRKRFWSFLYYSSTKNTSSSGKKTVKDLSFASSCSTINVSRDKKEECVVVEENESPNEAAFDRKVSRSRSVGCGSRSFSGDFFERISTGFGDCTLRRVESQREGKSKVHNRGSSATRQDCNIKERVRCGGIFSGFMITSSSSSSSSSSHWVSSEENVNGKSTTIAPASVGHQLVHGRSKSWGWAFASPMRAFSTKTSSSNGKRDASNKNATPNLAAIPSLLTARG